MVELPVIGRYGCPKVVSVGFKICDQCEVDSWCILVDSSSGEYGPIKLCNSCVDYFFHGFYKDEDGNFVEIPVSA